MHKFFCNDYCEALEARYFNANGYAVAIVASITRDVDWAAHIGADDGSRSESKTLLFVKQYGCKLSEQDARYFFPEIKLPYRN